MQLLATGEDLFDVDRHVILYRFRRTAGIEPVDTTAQAPAVATRVGQTVDVVDAQAVDQTVADQLEDLGVGFLEYHRPLDAQAAQLVDVEEASPVDVVAGGAPAGQSIMLAFKEAVQALEAILAGRVVAVQRLLERLSRFSVLQLFGQVGTQQASGLVRRRLGLQCIEMLCQRPQLRMLGGAQYLAVARRGDREAMLVVLGVQGAIVDIQAQFNGALLQRLAIVTAQEGHQQLPFEQGVRRIPFDVEELRIGAAATPFEHVQPPGVTGTTHGHVVGDDVQDQSHALAAQGLDETLQRRLAAQFRIDAGRVDHVIAVHGARAGREQR